jgi:sugar lactone lactonase YvrE
MPEVRCALYAGAALGESPWWCQEEQALYWVDSLEPAIKRFVPELGEQASWAVPQFIGGIALRRAGGAVLALGRGVALFDFTTGRAGPLALPSGERGDARFNDGKCDRAGRFWAGSHCTTEPRPPLGSLYCFADDLSSERRETGVSISNGLGWSPDDRTMYYTDTWCRAIYAYNFDLRDGRIERRRILVSVPEERGAPDGLTVDSAGHVWSANWDGWNVTRYRPDGQVDRVVPLPVQRPTSCALGGPNLRTLFITSARDGLTPAELDRQPLAGSILAMEVEVPGVPEPRFAG